MATGIGPDPRAGFPLRETPSQTAGPYVHIGLIPRQAGFEMFARDYGNVLAGPQALGERIRIEGHVFDGVGHPCTDVLLEIWQANAAGCYDHPADRQAKPRDGAFHGWGRAGTDFATGLYWFETVKPGRVEGRNGRTMAPHVSFFLVARGINTGLQTRMYFADEAAANASDPVLGLIEQPQRRQTLMASRLEREGAVVYLFDIHLQGARETVFLDV